MVYRCATCDTSINDRKEISIKCTKCPNWTHLNCTTLPTKLTSDHKKSFVCAKCSSSEPDITSKSEMSSSKQTGLDIDLTNNVLLQQIISKLAVADLDKLGGISA